MPYLFACFCPTPICTFPSPRFNHAYQVGHPSTNPRSFLLSLSPSPRPHSLAPFLSSPPLLIPCLNMRSLFTLLSLVASACAYQIISPGTSNGWTTGGTNNVTWQRVNTDQTTFTMVLVNQVRSSFLTRPFPPARPHSRVFSGQDRHASRLGSPYCNS